MSSYVETIGEIFFSNKCINHLIRCMELFLQGKHNVNYSILKIVNNVIN